MTESSPSLTTIHTMYRYIYMHVAGNCFKLILSTSIQDTCTFTELWTHWHILQYLQNQSMCLYVFYQHFTRYSKTSILGCLNCHQNIIGLERLKISGEKSIN